MFRSPLVMGGNLTSMDEWTASLLTNQEVIAVDQHSTENRELINTGSEVIWTAKPENAKGLYIAAFNLSDGSLHVQHPWNQVGLSGQSYSVRDLWERKDAGGKQSLDVTLAPHASVLYRVSESK
jgi:hypothetical protein